ncbi:MAG TPA: hypothetical protein VJ723_06915, partial [Candidatus Angelobacter sp.]|nr:hypothetical protein [Candidatus Angelobacter sp.]
MPELPRENRVREINRRGRFDGRPNAAPHPMPQHSKQRTSAPMQIQPVFAAKYNGAGTDLVLNDCLAYL